MFRRRSVLRAFWKLGRYARSPPGKVVLAGEPSEVLLRLGWLDEAAGCVFATQVLVQVIFKSSFGCDHDLVPVYEVFFIGRRVKSDPVRRAIQFKLVTEY